MKFLKFLRYLFITLALSSCDKDDFETKTTTVLVSEGLENSFLFKENSYWVYQDSLSNTDSITISSIETGITNVCPRGGCTQYEFFTVNYTNQTKNTSYNHYYYSNFIRYNGGGQFGENGQPIYILNQPPGFEFNGLVVGNIIDSLEILSNVYYNIEKMTVNAATQFQPEFLFDTDFYFVQNVGIVKMVIHDTINGIETWNLKRFNLQ